MAKVLCTLPNASDNINGVKFTEHDKGMLSEEISDEAAADFVAIPGFELVGAKQAEPEVDAEKAALLERAAAVDLKVKSVWGVDRLRAEVEQAEKAAAEQK